MELSKKLIELNSEQNEWLTHLKNLIEQSNMQHNKCGDSLIECSKSFIESIAKNILFKLDETIDKEGKKDINHIDINQLFKKCQKSLLEHSEIYNIIPKDHVENFFRVLGNWILFLSSIRNKTGEISHGKILPKPYSIQNEIALAINIITDSFSSILIAMIIEIDSSYTENVSYNKNEDFNAYLDETFEMPNGLSYSQAVYEQDYNLYETELENYLANLG